MRAKDLVRLKAKLFSKAKDEETTPWEKTDLYIHGQRRLKAKLLSKAKSKEETLTKKEMLMAVEQFLKYGEQSFNPEKAAGRDSWGGHGGYYSGSGWAARALRALRRHLDGSPIEL
jgi:hypothetical protein